MKTGINTLEKRYKIYNFILTVSSIAAMISAFGITVAYSVFDRTGCVQLLHKVVQCLSFQFLLRNSLLSLRAENLLDSRSF